MDGTYINTRSQHKKSPGSEHVWKLKQIYADLPKKGLVLNFFPPLTPPPPVKKSLKVAKGGGDRIGYNRKWLDQGLKNG